MIDFFYYFYASTKSHHIPLAWPPVWMPADAFPPFDAPFGIFKQFELARQRWFYEKKRDNYHVIVPECSAYKKNNKTATISARTIK